jgi:hypothetical protein
LQGGQNAPDPPHQIATDALASSSSMSRFSPLWRVLLIRISRLYGKTAHSVNEAPKPKQHVAASEACIVSIEMTET